MNNKEDLIVTHRSRVRRYGQRAAYDFETIAKILDETFLCHIGFAVGNQPLVIPTCYGRKEDNIYFHGANGSRMLEHIRGGAEICVTVSLLDGIVLAKSAMHHSVNYRSVVMFGKANELTDSVDKCDALETIINHIVDGRWDDVRKPNSEELNATSVFWFEIKEGSAKIRTGGPIENESDMKLGVWSGVLPLKIAADKPVADPALHTDVMMPAYVQNYPRKKS